MNLFTNVNRLFCVTWRTQAVEPNWPEVMSSLGDRMKLEIRVRLRGRGKANSNEQIPPTEKK